MSDDDDERQWLTLRLTCPHCGRLHYRTALHSCNLCEFFLRPRNQSCFWMLVTWASVYAIGMGAAWACRFFRE